MTSYDLEDVRQDDIPALVPMDIGASNHPPEKEFEGSFNTFEDSAVGLAANTEAEPRRDETDNAQTTIAEQLDDCSNLRDLHVDEELVELEGHVVEEQSNTWGHQEILLYEYEFAGFENQAHAPDRLKDEPALAADSRKRPHSELVKQKENAEHSEVGTTVKAESIPPKPASPSHQVEPKTDVKEERNQENLTVIPFKTTSGTESVTGSDQKSKKQRLVWTPELHKLFMDAVSALGVQNAVPKTVLQIMNVPSLTTEHVKSHLQKFRNNLKKDAAQEAKASAISSPCIPSHAMVNMQQFNGQVVQNPQHGGYPQGILPANNIEVIQRHLEWQVELQEKTMRFLLQMQMHHHQLVSLHRKGHLNLERQSRANVSITHGVDGVLKEYDALVVEQSSMQAELNRQQCLLRDLINEQELMRQRFREASSFTQLPIRPS